MMPGQIIDFPLKRDLRTVQQRFAREFRQRYKAHLIKNNLAGELSYNMHFLRQLENFTQRPAKRIRPFFLFLGAGLAIKYLRLESMPSALWDFACGIELVHAGMLVHDDIIDQAETRRGKSALHRIVGESQAIVLGDVAWSLGFDFMLQAKASPLKKEKAIHEFLKAAIMAGQGQALELSYRHKSRLSIKELYKMYELKTASYSFVAPLVMGAILESRGDHISFFTKVGQKLGILFQLTDDLLDVHEDKKSLLKKIKADVEEEKSKLFRDILGHIKRSALTQRTKDIFAKFATLIYARTN